MMDWKSFAKLISYLIAGAGLILLTPPNQVGLKLALYIASILAITALLLLDDSQ